jgi:Fe-S-cluster containining protein
VLFRYYRQLIDQVDKWTAEMTARYRQHLACRKGCDLCCQRKFTVSAVEAYNIARAYRQLPPDIQRRGREPKTACTFLIDGACSVYESRPILCRTFGLPSVNRDEKGQGIISWCELNFTEAGEDFQLQADGIIDIDMLNMKLAGVNGLFLKESGRTVERIAMDEVPDIDPDVVQRDQ